MIYPSKIWQLILPCVLVAATLEFCPALASNKLNSDLLPPDVTLSSPSAPSAAGSGSSSAPSKTPVPGTAGAAQSAPPKVSPMIQPPGGGTPNSGPAGNDQASQKPDPIATIETE